MGKATLAEVMAAVASLTSQVMELKAVAEPEAAPPTKMSRAESLEKARAARAAKRAEPKAEPKMERKTEASVSADGDVTTRHTVRFGGVCLEISEGWICFKPTGRNKGLYWPMTTEGYADFVRFINEIRGDAGPKAAAFIKARL